MRCPTAHGSTGIGGRHSAELPCAVPTARRLEEEGKINLRPTGSSSCAWAYAASGAQRVWCRLHNHGDGHEVDRGVGGKGIGGGSEGSSGSRSTFPGYLAVASGYFGPTVALAVVVNNAHTIVPAINPRPFEALTATRGCQVHRVCQSRRRSTAAGCCSCSIPRQTSGTSGAVHCMRQCGPGLCEKPSASV